MLGEGLWAITVSLCGIQAGIPLIDHLHTKNTWPAAGTTTPLDPSQLCLIRMYDPLVLQHSWTLMSPSVISAVVELSEIFLLSLRKLMCSQGVSLCSLLISVPELYSLSRTLAPCTGMWWTIPHMGRTYHHVTFKCLTHSKKHKRTIHLGLTDILV
jgi:hypothetical protein